MEAIVKQRQAEIDASIAREEASLAAITESLESADHMTKQMEYILENFGARLGKLEEAVVPIHKQTKDLQRLQDNIENVLNAIDNVVGYHHVAKRQKDLINKGVQGDLNNYIKSLSEVQSAVEFFAKNNPDSPELNRVKNLLSVGTKKMEEYFIELLKRNSKVPAPETILEVLDNNNLFDNSNIPRIDSSEGPRPVPIAKFERSIMLEIQKISKWLANDAKYDNYAKHYGQLRGNILHQTLMQLKEFIKQHGVAMLQKNSKNHKSLGRKQRRDPRGARSTGDEEVDLEIQPYIKMISAFVRLSEAEVSLMKAILPEEDFKKVFDLIVNIPLDSIKQDAGRFVRHCKECKVRRDYSGMLIVFPIVQHLKDEQPIAHNKALKFCSDDNRKVLQAIIHDMESAGAVTLESFIETIESESPSKENLPRDGTVHEMASNAFLFLEQLQAHSSVGGGMIAAKENDGISSPAQCKRAFSNYILRVLKAMKNNLQAKAKLYEESKALRALFLMNNFNFIIQRLNETDLINIIQDDILSDFDIQQKQNEYLKAWERVSNQCSINGIDSINEHKLKDKDRNLVKDRFKHFNAELEDMVASHQRYSVPDSGLRNEMRQKVKELLQPHYSVFRKTFIKKEFTTKVNKYIKYSEETMEEEIDKIFDPEA